MGVWIETCWISPARRKPPVTPYVGVWIETLILNNLPVRISCHTLRGCVDWNQLKKPLEVPPDVTPYVGVWIETRQSDNKHYIWQSHPTWVCGLKHKDFLLDITGEMESHPTWVCGLKHQWPSIRQYRRWSHPAWEYMDWSIVHSSVKFMEEL